MDFAAIEALGVFAAEQRASAPERSTRGSGLRPSTSLSLRPSPCRACRCNSRSAHSSRRRRTARLRWSRRCARQSAGAQRDRRPVRRPRHVRAGGARGLCGRSVAGFGGSAEARGAGMRGRASRPLPPPARRRGAGALRCGRSSIRRAPGAAEQVAALAASTVPRIAYVSCNPATFARDAKTLADGGYALDWVQPVGQFRWSTHVELAACFSR